MNEVFLSVVCAGAGLKKGANGEEGVPIEFRGPCVRVVLVGRFHVAHDDIRTWYLIKKKHSVLV